MDVTTFWELVKKGECTEIEFKQQFPKQANDMAKEMAAIANASGGYIFIGVDDKGELIGVQDSDQILQRLAGLASQICKPPLNPDMEKLKIEDKCIVYVHLIKITIPCSIDGKFYRRVGPTVQTMTYPEIKEIADRGIPIFSGFAQPRGYLYLDSEGIDRLYSDYLDSSAIGSSLPNLTKLEALITNLYRFRGKGFYDNLQDAIKSISNGEDGTFLNIHQKFDAPQFINYGDGISEVNSIKRVAFAIGLTEAFNFRDDYYKKNPNDQKIIMSTDLAKWPNSKNGMAYTGHDGTFIRAFRGKNLPLGVFGYLRSISEYSFQIKPYAIWTTVLR